MLDVGTETTKEARHEISWGWVCPLLLVLLFLMSWRRKKGPSTCWAKRESISGKSEFCMKASCLRGSSGAQGVTLGWGGQFLPRLPRVNTVGGSSGVTCWGSRGLSPAARPVLDTAAQGPGKAGPSLCAPYHRAPATAQLTLLCQAGQLLTQACVEAQPISMKCLPLGSTRGSLFESRLFLYPQKQGKPR